MLQFDFAVASTFALTLIFKLKVEGEVRLDPLEGAVEFALEPCLCYEDKPNEFAIFGGELKGGVVSPIIYPNEKPACTAGSLANL